MSQLFLLVSQVLRDPVGVVERSESSESLAQNAPPLLGIAVVGALLFSPTRLFPTPRGSLRSLTCQLDR